MIIPKNLRAKPPKPFSPHGEAHFDVYAEQFSEDVECHIQIDFSSDDSREIRRLAAWLEKAAAYLDRCE